MALHILASKWNCCPIDQLLYNSCQSPHPIISDTSTCLDRTSRGSSWSTALVFVDIKSSSYWPNPAAATNIVKFTVGTEVTEAQMGQCLKYERAGLCLYHYLFRSNCC